MSKQGLAVAIVIALVLVPLHAGAIEYKPIEGELKIFAGYYILSINLTGGTISSWTWRDGNIELIECKEPAGRVVLGGVDLSSLKWGYEVVYNNSDLIVLKLYPSEKLPGNYSLEVYYTFYQWKPYIDVEYVVKAKQAVNVTGNATRLKVYWTALSGDPATWRLLYYDMAEGSVMEVLEGFTNKALWVGAVDNASKLFVGVLALQQRQLIGVNLGKRDCISFELSYKRVDLAAGGSTSYALRVYYGASEPRWLEEAGMVGAAASLNSTLYSDYEKVAQKPAWYVSQLEKLNEERANLSRKVYWLEQNVTQLKGEIDNCQNNLYQWKEKISSELNTERQKLMVQRYVFLAAGVVFGFLAALAAFQLGAAETIERLFKKFSKE